MTEGEWLACGDPTKMLAFVGGQMSERRCWTFVAACTRRLPKAVMSAELVRAIYISTRFAEGSASEEELRAVYPRATATEIALNASRLALQMTNDAHRDGERAEQVAIIRCVFPDPFRPVAFDPSWRTSTAVGLAESIHQDKAFDRLPILADALQDAGCEDERVLAHCRGDGPHTKGCWVIDTVMGRG